MQAFLISPQAEESAILTVILQKAGLMVRSSKQLTRISETWPRDPVDLILIAAGGIDADLLTAIRQIRLQTAVPVLLILDQVPETGQVECLEAGIDHLICRPYGNRLLIAQINALLRRTAGTALFQLPKFTQQDVVLDPSNRTVRVGTSGPVHLTHLEFRLLHTLITHPGQVIPSENIVEHVWGYSGDGNRELVRGLVQRLRSKVEPDPAHPRYIKNELGVGYYFEKSG